MYSAIMPTLLSSIAAGPFASKIHPVKAPGQDERKGMFMKVLVVNCGSSSLKYQFDMTDESVLAKGLVERIGIEARASSTPDGYGHCDQEHRHTESQGGVQDVAAELLDPVNGVLKSRTSCPRSDTVVHAASATQGPC